MRNGKIFIEETRIQVDAIFQENGMIHIYPAGHELGRHVTLSQRVLQRGKMVTDANGESHFQPYRNGGPRVKPLYMTQHAILKEAPSSIICTFKFPKTMTRSQMAKALRSQAKALADHIVKGGTVE